MFSEMTPKVKNAVITGAVLLLVTLICGYLVLFYLPGRIDNAHSLNESLKTKISSLREIGKEYYHVQELLQQKEEKLLVMNKVINSEVTPADTYEYLNSLLDYSGFVDFDMRFQGSKDLQSYGYNVYQIKGQGDFDRIYKFISYIERGPQIYRIKKMSLRARNADKFVGEEPEIPFNMQVWAYYANLEDLPAPRISLDGVTIDQIKNPFSASMAGVQIAPRKRKRSGNTSRTRQAPKAPANPRGLVEVGKAKLKAVMLGRAMIEDHKGKTHMLREGDEVFLGAISKIDQTNNRVEIKLNDGSSHVLTMY
ncbi:MAG: hypothetical protein ACRBF0_00150 [Calditrichia bacterium]